MTYILGIDQQRKNNIYLSVPSPVLAICQKMTSENYIRWCQFEFRLEDHTLEIVHYHQTEYKLKVVASMQYSKKRGLVQYNIYSFGKLKHN